MKPIARRSGRGIHLPWHQHVVLVVHRRADAMVAGVNRRFDALARTAITVCGRPLPAFRVCGVLGYGFGVIAGALLAAAHGRSPWLVVGLGAVAAVTFIVVSAVALGPDGEERVVQYHHQLAILATTTATLVLAGAPVLSYLDSVAVGIGVFLTFGRVGCLLVGCCHGLPARVGICYREAHVQEGLAPHRAGVRLLPVPAIDAAWTLAAVGIGIAAASRGPGAGAAAFLVTHAAGRFVLEYARGDGGRSYWLAMSEAQWTSVVVTAVVVGAERLGAIPSDPLHTASAAVLAGVTSVTASGNWLRRGSDGLLLTPRHLDEVGWVVAHLAGRASIDARAAAVPVRVPSCVHVAETSQGLTISASTLLRADGVLHHFALSRTGGLMPRTAAALGETICRLIGDEPLPALPSRGGDVFHLSVLHRW